ncbi:MAG TPA: histidine kinase [Rubrivivax sp.]|nr:histidine kinase [Rubrivivax sp.]
MSHPPVSPRVTAANSPQTPTSAWAAALVHSRKQGWRHLWVVGALCVGIALLLTAIDGRGFFNKLVYSLAIGTVCTLVVDASRLLMVYASHRWRQARSLPLQPERFAGWSGALPGLLLCTIAGPLVGLWLGDLITGNRSPSLWRLESTTTRLTLVMSVLGTIVSAFVISTLQNLAAAREQAQAAKALASENQLRLLRSQLEPHMLFNTLANLRVLIGIDPPQAQAMLDRLIAFLRATLNASRADAQPLATEFAQLADYLALMALRMGPRLQVRLDLPEALAARLVPPLLLQPLVENAIKHGLEPQVEGGRIDVAAHSERGWLVLTVRDTGVGLAAAQGQTQGRAQHETQGPTEDPTEDATRDPAPGPRQSPPGTESGFGLSQIRERLATQYGNRASLTLQPAPDSDGGVLATVRIPQP